MATSELGFVGKFGPRDLPVSLRSPANPSQDRRSSPIIGLERRSVTVLGHAGDIAAARVALIGGDGKRIVHHQAVHLV